jgi:hypothetical protein
MRRLQFTSIGARAAVATRAGSWILPFVNLVSAGSHGPAVPLVTFAARVSRFTIALLRSLSRTKPLAFVEVNLIIPQLQLP